MPIYKEVEVLRSGVGVKDQMVMGMLIDLQESSIKGGAVSELQYMLSSCDTVRAGAMESGV
jgi:hypothetical protein